MRQERDRFTLFAKIRPERYGAAQRRACTVWMKLTVNGSPQSSTSGRPRSSAAQMLMWFLKTTQGALWVGTGFGLFRRRQNGVIERFGAEQGIPLADRNTLLEDREGTLWLGTGSGLFQLVPHPEVNRSAVARVYTTRDGLGSNFVTSLFQSSDGRLWIGTDNALHERLPGGQQRRRTVQKIHFGQWCERCPVDKRRSRREPVDRHGNAWSNEDRRQWIHDLRHGRWHRRNSNRSGFRRPSR